MSGDPATFPLAPGSVATDIPAASAPTPIRRTTVPAESSTDDLLTGWQLAMADRHDWLPVATERSDRREWLTRAAPGATTRYRVTVAVDASGERWIEETLVSAETGAGPP